MDQEDTDNESSCRKKSKMMIATLTGEILTAALRETQFDYQVKPNSVYGYFGLSDFPCREPNG